MSNQLRASVVLDHVVDRGLVETLLTSSPRLTVVDYFELEGRNPGQDSGDVLVVACGDYTSDVAEYVAESARRRPNLPVVLFAPMRENGYVSEVFGNGADDLVALPGDDPEEAARVAGHVVFTLEKAVARKQGVPLVSKQTASEMICVLGLKGGSGKTVTAANLAVALAIAGERVSVIDLDLQFGDLGLALGLAPDRTLHELAQAGGSLDAAKVGDFMAEHPSGVRALLAPRRPDQAARVTSDFLREVFGLMREQSGFVIVDTPPGFTPEVIAAVDSSSSVCMVATLDALSLKNTRIGLETLEQMDYDPAKIRIVLNRADSNVGISPDDVVAIMGASPAVMVPSDRDVTRSINRGEPITLWQKHSDITRAFNSLAKLYINDTRPAGQTNGKRRGLLRRG
jgi:pilus assembly protein CpaE